MSYWKIIYTKPKQEARATEHLENQGVRVYFPKFILEKIVRGKLKDTLEPLFPRYLFVKIPDSVSWTSARSSRGVVDFIKFGNQVAEISDNLVQSIEQSISENKKLVYGDIPEIGQKVYVTQGEFAGLEGVFEQRDGEKRCFVLLELLGRDNRVRIEISHLKKTA